MAHLFNCNCKSCGILSRVCGDIDVAVANLPLAGNAATANAQAEAVEKMINAAKNLEDAKLFLHRVHRADLYDPSTGQCLPLPPPRTSPTRPLHTIQPPPLVGKANTSPTHNRQVTNPFAAKDGGSPTKSSTHGSEAETSEFRETVRARAAELGILREQRSLSVIVSLNPAEEAFEMGEEEKEAHACGHHIFHIAKNGDGTSPPKSATFQDKDSPTKEKSQFIVCDHCRSHGIRCNEASVCKECILREVPCTHRQCDLSPNSRSECPRQVCFYVHGDWMPDVHGKHNPKDLNWLILPGKLREHLSAGQLGKLPFKEEDEIMRCYGGVAARQAIAVQEMGKCVQSGRATWENVAMQCVCLEVEREEQRMRNAETEENLRRLTLNAGSSNASSD